MFGGKVKAYKSVLLFQKARNLGGTVLKKLKKDPKNLLYY